MASAALLPAGQAFDALAERFDELFDPWLSVAAQRRAVRGELLAAFPRGASILEIGGGTGTDAAWLADQGRQVFLTDASPAMVDHASRKIGAANAQAIAAEELGQLAVSGRSFDGRGNFSLGLREQLVYPEIDYDKIDRLRGLEISIVTTAKTDEEGRKLLELMGMPFQAQ